MFKPDKRKVTIYSQLVQRKLKRQLKKIAERNKIKAIKPSEEHDSHIVDDMPLTLSRESGPGRQHEMIQRDV
jgi:hypothetical protein